MLDIGDDPLVLNHLTGKVHRYCGISMDGLIPCECELIDELKDTDHLVYINRRVYEESIWVPADCMAEE